MGDILQKYGIEFDEARHLYTRRGFPLPSVTQILPFKCDGPEDVIRKAAERGHRVHKWIEFTETDVSQNLLSSPVIEDADVAYCQAWLKFKDITGFELASISNNDLRDLPAPDDDYHGGKPYKEPLVERFIYHPGFQYVGRLDLIGYLRRIPDIEEDLTLVDAKTVAKIYPATALQTSAYMMAINLELKALGLPLVKHRWAAQLRPDGSCRRESYPAHKEDFSVFLARLNWMRWATGNGYETLDRDYFVEPETAQREVEEVMARL